ncbi:MAG: KH domain-containing protein, partial [Kiritimatiellia bacterium]
HPREIVPQDSAGSALYCHRTRGAFEDHQTRDGQPLLRVRALILTTDDRHQRMLIGRDGRKIKEIGTASRQELEVAMNYEVFPELDVVVDEHWVNTLV